MRFTGCGKVRILLFGRERRALALRKIQQIQGALAPGLSFRMPQSSFSAASLAAEGRSLFQDALFSTLSRLGFASRMGRYRRAG
jgi:hypothetical protein